ncbi:unnamed protein product, partial [Gongylonema pulchrum]|uniref:E3 ubiquitin-protein ligase n=1 Tax=Gongylonema pulchrum TaxID=637853 RepID=A0A183EJV7_9BILA
MIDDDKVKLATVFATLTQKISPPLPHKVERNEDSDTDDECGGVIQASTSAAEPDILTRPFYLKSVISELRELLSDEVFTNVLLTHRDGLASVCALAYFIRLHSLLDHTALMSLFSSFRRLIPNLWQLITSLSTKAVFGTTQPIISMLERGENISQGDEQSLITALSLFITMMTNVLMTVDDDDFQNGGFADAAVPLTLRQIADVVVHCRDLTLGLIDLAFPVNTAPFQSVSQAPLKSSKWSDLFQEEEYLSRKQIQSKVVNLTKRKDSLSNAEFTKCDKIIWNAYSCSRYEKVIGRI